MDSVLCFVNFYLIYPIDSVIYAPLHIEPGPVLYDICKMLLWYVTVADPDLELGRGPGLFYLPSRLFFLTQAEIIQS